MRNLSSWPRSLARSVATAPSDLALAARLFGPRGWLSALAGITATLLILGLPIGAIPNPIFTRIIPIRPQDYVIWAVTAVLVGLVVGSYAAGKGARQDGKVVAGGVLSFLAAGCPVCNKIVVALLGASGALAWFAPVQLYLGILSIALLAWTLRVRARALVGSCSIPPSPRTDEKSAVPA